MFTPDTAGPLVSCGQVRHGFDAAARWRALYTRLARNCPGNRVLQTVYLCGVTAAGMLVVLASIWQVATAPVGAQWFILAALTVLSGAATLRLPNVPVSFSISDSMTMTAAVLFGPAAGALMVTLDTLVISFRLTRRENRVRRLLFNAAAPALAMWTAAHVFFLLAGVEPLVNRIVPLTRLAMPLAVFAVLFFVLNSGLIAGAVALEQRTKLMATWRRYFPGFWLSYFAVRSPRS